jgi:hypothetical protein
MKSTPDVEVAAVVLDTIVRFGVRFGKFREQREVLGERVVGADRELLVVATRSETASPGARSRLLSP